jgi:transmembrane sensor
MEQDIDILLAKALSGALSSAEQQHFEEWLAADPANKDDYERVQALWDEADNALDHRRFDTDAAWAKVAAATGISEEPMKTVRMGIPSWLKMGIAAAVLIAGLFLYRFFDGSEEMVEILAAAQNQSFVLPDQSQVTLRKGAAIRYPKEFDAKERHVSLRGEAFFEVTPDAERPFLVDAGDAIIKVLGTSFNVACSNNEALVTVASGKVQLSDARTPLKNTVVLTPGKQGRLKKGVISTDIVSSDSYLYWKTGKLSFREEPFRNVIKELGDLGHTTITFDPAMPAAPRAQLIDISFKDQSLEEMLTDLCLITHCEWSKGNDGYTVRTAD